MLTDATLPAHAVDNRAHLRMPFESCQPPGCPPACLSALSQLTGGVTLAHPAAVLQLEPFQAEAVTSHHGILGVHPGRQRLEEDKVGVYQGHDCLVDLQVIVGCAAERRNGAKYKKKKIKNQKYVKKK